MKDLKQADENVWLDRMQLHADPLADNTMADIMGAWTPPVVSLESGDIANNTRAWISALNPQWKKIEVVSKILGDWTSNQNVKAWQPSPSLPPVIGTPLLKYVASSGSLPDWADPAKMARAEELFMDYGALSVTLLFCASLPECYVIPDLSAVLHISGQLEKHTDYRVRSTGAMIFPVMMHGGLTDPAGGGVAQIFKVRLIHATIRNLMLRKNPGAGLMSTTNSTTTMGASPLATETADIVAPLSAFSGASGMYQVLFAHGWNTHADGLPCNQEELAYTLLTFSYVFLRGMRTLGLRFSMADEEAYLHTWNVAGSLLGIEHDLMADTMAEAALLFTRMQARGRADQRRHTSKPDPRPDLGNALVKVMESVIPIRILKSFPLLMTRHLVGTETSKDLGLNAHSPWSSRLLFYALLAASRAVDSMLHIVWPDFSITRFLVRVLGYRLITQLMMDQTRPLKLPQELINRVSDVVASWSDDKKAPRWLNKVEDRLTTAGSWSDARPQ